MRDELDLLLTHGAAALGAEGRPLTVDHMEHEFCNECRAGAPRGRGSAPESRYVR